MDLELVGSGYRMSLVKRRFATGMPHPAAATLLGARAQELWEAFGLFGKDRWVSGMETQAGGRPGQGGMAKIPVGGIKKEDECFWVVPWRVGVLAKIQGLEPEAPRQRNPHSVLQPPRGGAAGANGAVS